MSSNDRNWIISALLIIVLFAMLAMAQTREPTSESTAEKTMSAADGVTVSVKMIGPVTQETDLQVICMLKHDPAGDKYLEAMQTLNEKLSGLLSSLRDRGEFAGDLGETLLLTPPRESIKAKQLLLIGVGPESNLSLEPLGLAGRIAAREGNRLHATTISFAPTLRDQGSKRIDVGDGDAATAEQFLLAFDTETRLAAQKLADPPSVKALVIEAGPTFFESAAEKVAAAINNAGIEIEKRYGASYLTSGK